MSKKRMIIFTSVILSVVVISLGIVKLYQTYAIGNYIDTASSATFDVNITRDTSVRIPANGYSNVFYMVTNTSPGTVRYGVAYTTDSAVTVKTFSTSKDSASGMIEENEKKYVKLRLENTSSTVKNIKISTILGYTGGGELLPPNGVTLVTDIYNPVPLAQYITGLYTSGTKTEATNNNVKYNRVTSKNLINDRLGGTTADYNAGNIRYYGSNPNNYIYFNCSDYRKQNSNTCELWRIIGVFDGKVKIIRNESIGNLAWDQDKNDSSSSTTYDNNWSTSTSQRFLNNKYYNGNKIGTVTYYSGASGGTSTSLNMSNIGLKNDSTRNMIANTTLKIGGWSSYSIFPHQVYEYERGTTVYSGRPTTWYGKIGLMYLSDYGYATDIELCQQNLYNYENTNCKNNNWLFNNNSQWSIVHVSNSQGKSFSITSSGWVSTSNATYYQASIRPTIFLYKNVLFESGTGTIDNPYKISSGTSTNLDDPIPNYTIMYNANNGSGAPSSQTKVQNVDVTLSTTVPTRSGYQFAGWNTSANGSGTSYAAGAVYSENSNVTLYAQWKQVFTITYNANSGSGAPSDQSKVQGDTITLSTNKPTKTGNTFTGWNTSSGGSGTSYAAGATYSADSSITLYAQWKPNVVTIKFNINGGTLKSSSPYAVDSNGNVTRDGKPLHTMNYNDTIISTGLPNYNNSSWLNIAKTGYTAVSNAEWKCLSGNCIKSTYGQDNATYKASDFCNLNSGDCTITLGVNWTPAKIKITLNANGGTVGTSAIWYYYGINTFYSNEACTTKITSITVPTRYGYTFNHYYGDGSSGGNNGERYIYSGGTFADDLVTDIYQSTTFYANWSESLIYRYVKPLIGLNCRSGAGSSYSIVTAFSCGTRLALDPNPTNGWYYSAANGCWLSGDYLVTSTPNCSGSSGGTSSGGGLYGTCYCSSNNDCGYSGTNYPAVWCSSGKCYWKRAGNNNTFSCD
jgi:leucine-rich repeat (lrr) protein